MVAHAQIVSTNIRVHAYQVTWEHDVKQVSVEERSTRQDIGKLKSFRAKRKETERTRDCFLESYVRERHCKASRKEGKRTVSREGNIIKDFHFRLKGRKILGLWEGRGRQDVHCLCVFSLFTNQGRVYS